jgi:8-oxo-dGTP pyrophosphatase MutT (NUDIX family)
MRTHHEREQLSKVMPGETHEELVLRRNKTLREHGWGVTSTKKDGPTVSGVALKAADTGRILMLQRGLDDDKDDAAGTWEFPGGHHEDGDLTSLHAGIREWQEEVGQPFPDNGVVHHTWTSPNGIYQGHVVVIPSEKDLSMKDGRVLPNPDDPKGDSHEQAAWWDPAHAQKNPALREELKSGTPWKEIAAAGNAKTASSWDALSYEDDQPGFPRSSPPHSDSENPASTGFATSQDPADWNSQADTPTTLLPSGSYEGSLHDEPEAALPSTDGDRDDFVPEGQRGHTPRTDAATMPHGYDDLTEFQEDHPEFYQVPDTHGEINSVEDSATPNQFTGSVGDIVAQFQATTGARAIQEGGLKGDAADNDIAAAAQAHLKTALKDFNFQEQQELINEGLVDHARARNFGSLDIGGTHYEALSKALGFDEDDPEELFS